MERNIEQIVERQLAKWQARERRPVPSEDRRPHERANVIVVSSAPGCDGQQVAEHIAERLKIPHHDQDIVEHIASTAHVRLRTVESLDRHVQSRMDEYLESLFHERNFDRSDYMRLLGQVVVALWEHGPCVFSGHGAVHLISQDHALAVRLVAPAEVRIRRLAEQRQLDLREARRQVHRADAEQAAFHRRYFGAHVDDPEHYHLVVNTARVSGVAVVELAVQAFARLFAR